MIRVLHVVTHMNRGGLETMIMNYYRNIDRTKVQFDFLTHRSEKKDYDDEIESMGGKIFHLPALNPFNLKYRSELNRFFTEHKEYKIVHSHLDCMSSLPLYYAKKHGVPVRIAHSHNTSQEQNLKFILKKYYRDKIPNNATDLFACSNMAGDWMFNNNEYTVMRNAIEAEKYSFDENVRSLIRNELNIDDKTVLGHIGRFNIQKNHDFLIDIFNEYHKMNESSVLMLIGVGDLEEKIKAKVKNLGLEKDVLFMGLRSDIPRILNGMDLFVFPSLFEGFGIVVLEAQANGLACLITDGITKEVVILDNLFRMSLDKPAYSWATRINEIVNKKTERKNTYEYICKSGYDIKSNAKWLEDYYLKKAGKNL